MSGEGVYDRLIIQCDNAETKRVSHSSCVLKFHLVELINDAIDQVDPDQARRDVSPFVFYRVRPQVRERFLRHNLRLLINDEVPAIRLDDTVAACHK